MWRVFVLTQHYIQRWLLDSQAENCTSAGLFAAAVGVCNEPVKRVDAVGNMCSGELFFARRIRFQS